jgi:hypothetical protein
VVEAALGMPGTTPSAAACRARLRACFQHALPDDPTRPSAGDVVCARATASLRCPLTRTRMRLPCVSAACAPHLQCFDLGSIVHLTLLCDARERVARAADRLQTGESPSPGDGARAAAPSMRCPLCAARFAAADVRVDSVALAALAQGEAAGDVLEVDPDGATRVLSPAQVRAANARTNVEDVELL